MDTDITKNTNTGGDKDTSQIQETNQSASTLSRLPSMNNPTTSIQSSQDMPSMTRKSDVFSSSDFLNFLREQGNEIQSLEVITTSGNRISANFHNGNSKAPNTLSNTGTNTANVHSDNGNGKSNFGEEEKKEGAPNDVFKSIDALKAIFNSTDEAMNNGSTPPGSTATSNSASISPAGPSSSFFTSKDWSVDYAKSHVDVTYDSLFQKGKKNPHNLTESTGGGTSIATSHTGKNIGKTDWNAMYSSALSPLVEAAARAQPHPVQQKFEEPNEGKRGQKRKPRKIIPETKEYVDTYTDADVLFGRGGRSNHHPGNKMYRDLVMSKQQYYRGCDKNAKTLVAQGIVDQVHNVHKGRFLEKETGTGRYYIVPNLMARRKVGQALRENNTEEARLKKRRKYSPSNTSKDTGSIIKEESVAVDTVEQSIQAETCKL